VRRLFHSASITGLFFCIAVLLVIADRAPLHLDKGNPSRPIETDFYLHYHSVLDRTIGGPYAYRVLVPWVTALLHGIYPSFAEINIDAALKTLVLFLILLAFFLSQQRFFTPWIALAGTLWMSVLIGYSLAYVQGPASGETTDLLNLLVFILALDLMLDGRMGALAALLFVGMLNRETPLLLLPLIYTLDHSTKRGPARTAGLTLGMLVIYVGLRLAIPTTTGGWFTFQGLGMNIPGYESGRTGEAVQSIVHVLLLLAPLFGLAASGFSRLSLFFRGSILLAAGLVIIHFIVATVIESRLWMPEFALLIPPSLQNLRRILAGERISGSPKRD
jgi:hypothetical protein